MQEKHVNEMFADGYHDLPAGKIASVVTYLKMSCPPADRAPEREGWVLRRRLAPDLDWYRALFRAVGQEWLWFSRLQLEDEVLHAIIHDPAVDVFSLEVEGKDRGLLELDRRHMPDIELAFIGVIPDFIGSGGGRFLLAHGLELAWSHSPRQVLVHTCTLDHPRALGLYMKAGFVPYKRALEVADDPRVDGTLTRDAAPQCPVLKT
jgi:GNAT superfamily N-acetyltransferase